MTLTRADVYALGVVATQAGVSTPEELQRLIRLGAIAPTRAGIAIAEIAEGNRLNAIRVLRGILE